MLRTSLWAIATVSFVNAPEYDVARDVALGCAAHERLLARLDALAAAGALEAERPTLLPEWTVGHVLTHLARNGDGHRRMIEGAERGEVLDQYVGGIDGRLAEIAAGATRPIEALLDDVRTSIVRLEHAWAGSNWIGTGKRTLGEETPISQLPFRRVREVEIHQVDLGVGVTVHDLDALYVRLDLRRLEMLWTARQPMGLTPLPDAVLALAPPDRLAWFTGRHVVDGVRAAGLF